MGIMESMQGLNTESIFNAFNTGVLAKVYFFLKIGFWMGLVMIGGGMAYKFYFQYKIRLTVHKRIGERSVEVYPDKAKIIVDAQNKRKLQLYKTKKGAKTRATMPIPEAKFMGKQGRYDHYHVWLDDNFELHPIDTPLVDPNEMSKLQIRPQERAAWGRMEDELLYKKFQKKDVLLKYATPAILMTACITAFLIFFFASKEIGSGLTSLAQTFQQVASSCTKLG